MTRLQTAIGLACDAATVVLLVGVLVRRRYRACYAFAVYLAVVLAASLLMKLWPARFYTFNFWLLKETVYNLLKFAVALELAFRTFQAFPGALAAVRRLLLLVLLVSYAALVVATPPNPEYATLIAQMHPRILNGTIWVFTVIAALVLWYRLPVRPFHKAILIGFVPYLLVFTVALNAMDALDWKDRARELFNYVHTVAYFGVLLYWSVAAWRADPVRAHTPAPLPSFGGSEQAREAAPVRQ